MFCINPNCHADVPDEMLRCCPECGTTLLISDRFIPIRPLRPFNPTLTYSILLVLDQQTGEERVMKVLDYPTEQSLRYFEREAALLGNLRHPGLPIVDLDDDGFFSEYTTNSKHYPKVYCLVMEKVDGIDLDQFIKKHGSIGEKKALEWMRQLVEIVHYLHQKGLFHRDIKPSNLILKPDGKIVLIDFGTVREITDTYLCKIGRGPNYVTEVNDVTIVNSVSYSPFEQTQGKAVLQSDFYSIGRTFIYLLTGMSPLKFSQNAGHLYWKLSAHHVSQPFADFLNRMMSLLPIDRPRDTQEILTILQRLPGEIKRYRWLQSPWVKLVKFAIGIVIFLVFVKVMLWYFSERYFSFALQSASIGNFDKAELYIKSAIAYDSDNPRFHLDLAVVCQKVGTVRSNQCAIKHYEQALQLNPKNQNEVRYTLGNLYEKVGDRKNAKLQFSEILKKDEKFIDARNDLVQILILERQYTSAEKLILPALSQSQDKFDRSVLLKNLGWLQFEQQQYVKASESLVQALKLNEPDRTDAHCLLAQVYDSAPNLGTATVHWRSCLLGTATTPEVKSWQQQKIRQLLKTEKITVPEPPSIWIRSAPLK